MEKFFFETYFAKGFFCGEILVKNIFGLFILPILSTQKFYSIPPSLPTFVACLCPVAQVDLTRAVVDFLILPFVALYLCFSYKFGLFWLLVA